MKKMKKNYVYNLSYKLINILLSVITIPYISRILGSEGVGLYSYTSSIVSYFILFAILGIKNYGNRLIASNQNNQYEKSKQFISLYVFQLITFLIVLSVYLMYVFLICKEYQNLYLIQIIYLISALFDVNWFFSGIEKFKKITTVNTFVKLLSFISILLIVKDANDINLYLYIMSLSFLISNLLIFIMLPKEINFVKVNKNDVLKHIKPCMVLFIPVIAVSLYKVMDKIMLGSIVNIQEVGYYEQAEKILSIPLCLIDSLSIVMFPKATNLLLSGKYDVLEKYIVSSMKFLSFLIFPIVFGIISVADDFSLIFLGEQFTKSAILLKGLSISILFVAWANVIRTQYLFPKHKDKVFVCSVCVGAIINLSLNILLIPYLKGVGAVLTTIVAELVVALIQTLSVRKELNLKLYLKSTIEFFLKALVMIIVISIIGFLVNKNIYIKLFLKVTTGILVYILLNIKYVKNIHKETN